MASTYVQEAIDHTTPDPTSEAEARRRHDWREVTKLYDKITCIKDYSVTTSKREVVHERLVSL